jgi:hypothetical protein
LLAIRTDPLRAAAPGLPLIRAPVAAADHVVIESTSPQGEAPETTRVELSRHDKSWTIDNYFNAPATASRVDAMLGRLAGLKRGLPIATSSAALQRFRVADQDFARKLTLGEGGKTLVTVYFGSSSGVRSVDARAGDDRVVYTVDYATYEIPVLPGDWFDGDLLGRPPQNLHAIEIDYGDHRPVHLERQTAKGAAAAGWLPIPPPSALQPGQTFAAEQAEDLARALGTVHVDAVLGTEAKPEWQQAHPMIVWTLTGSDQHAETWTLSKPDGNGEFRVLKSSAHPWFFSVSASGIAPLLTASGRDQLFPTVKSAAKPAAKPAATPAVKPAAEPAANPSH